MCAFELHFNLDFMLDMWVASDIGYSYILCAKNNGNSCPLACKINGTSSSGFLARLTWSNLLWGESPSQEVYSYDTSFLRFFLEIFYSAIVLKPGRF